MQSLKISFNPVKDAGHLGGKFISQPRTLMIVAINSICHFLLGNF